MGMENGFRVEPAALHRLAVELEGVADRVAQMVSRFAAAPPLVGTFGLLPQASAAHQRYAAKVQEGLEGLRSVHGALRDSAAGGLRVVAGNYLRADGSSTPAER